MSEPPGRSGTFVHFFIWALALLGFYLASRFSLPLFHSLAGLFSVIIAWGVFAVAWNSRGFLENNYLLFLGIAYLFVGALDLLRTLAYGGMAVFPGFGADLPVQLGFAARGLESLSLCLAPLSLGRRLHPYAVLGGYLLALAGIALMIFVWPVFPLPEAAGPGLTALRRTAGCLPGVILLGALALLWRHREEFDLEVLRLLLAAIALAAGAELARTMFPASPDQAGVPPQLLKILSLFLIYRALIQTGLRRPYNLLFRHLQLGEAMVRQERDFADRLMETVPVMVLILDPQGRIVCLNPAGERLTGYALAEVQGRLFWEVFPAPEAVDAMKEGFYHFGAGEVRQEGEFDWVARDGVRRLIAWSAAACIGENGSVFQVIGTGIDITDRKETEIRLQRLQAELAGQVLKDQSQPRKLEVLKRELDRFTAAAARDLRSPLRWISGYCQALEAGDHRLDFRGRRYLRRLRRMVRQTAELTEVRLENARLAGAAMARQEIDLSGQARDIAAALRRTAPERRVEFTIGSDLRAAGDPAMLRLVLSILLENAWKFTETAPRGQIAFEALPTTDGTRGFLVRDNRPGLAPNGGRGVFRAFRRFHVRDFPARAPGLVTVKRIIGRHGGLVWGEIELRQGATFYFTLPPPGPEPAAKPSRGDNSGKSI